MPYIKNEDKLKFDKILQEVLNAFSEPPGPLSGELNYLISSIIREYINAKGLRYATLNDVIGVLDSAKMEFYRRVVAPYEEEKMKENGDVY